MSREQKLLDAIGEISEEMIAEAAEPEKLRKGRHSKRTLKHVVFGGGLVAAAVVFILFSANSTLLYVGRNGDSKMASKKNAGDLIGENGQAMEDSVESGDDLELYIDHMWLEEGQDTGEELAEKSAGGMDQAQGEPAEAPAYGKKKTEPEEQEGSRDAYSSAEDADGDSYGQQTDSQVRLQTGETVQIWPQNYISHREGNSKDQVLEEHVLDGKYFELNLGEKDADTTYQIIPKYGVVCSGYTVDGNLVDCFLEKVPCQSGDTVQFLLQDTSEETESSGASGQDTAKDMTGLEESDWEEQGINPIAKIVIQVTSGGRDRILYIGTKEGQYYLWSNRL